MSKKKVVKTTGTKAELTKTEAPLVEAEAPSPEPTVEPPTLEEAVEAPKEAPPIEEPPTAPAEAPAELSDADQFELLKTQLLDIYEAAPTGQTIPLWHLLKETGATVEQIHQAWDWLYDRHKVPVGYFYKPTSS